MEVLMCNMSLKQKCDISSVMKAVVLIMLPFLQNLEVIRAACTKVEEWVFSVENLWIQILFPPLLLRVHNKSSLVIFTWGNDAPEWYVIAYSGATNIFNLLFYKSTNFYGFPELFMNWGTAVWWKGKKKKPKPQTQYLKNICTEQVDRPMHLYLRSEWDPSQLILHRLPLVPDSIAVYTSFQLQEQRCVLDIPKMLLTVGLIAAGTTDLGAV